MQSGSAAKNKLIRVGNDHLYHTKKYKKLCFILDLRELNKQIKKYPYQFPKIQDLLLKLNGFQYTALLDINMRYYHIKLPPESQKLCNIVLPLGIANGLMQ